MTSVLMVLSGARVWTLEDGTEHPTGFWAEEFIAPYDIFTEAGYDITVATPGGVVPVVDELSLGISGGTDPLSAKKLKSRLAELDGVLKNPADLHEQNEEDYDLVFYPGGHAPMEDLAFDEYSGRMLAQRLAAGRPLALLCHAPAAILAAGKPSPFAGRKVTGLSNREELMNSFAKKAKWLLEDELVAQGLDYDKGLLPFTPHVVVDGNLYTGQNPQSSKKLAKTLVEVLGAQG